jgi:molybdenum cofactor cytidylyltransferase
MNSSTVGLIILAAGASTRMGTPKQLLAYRGCSFIRHIAEVAIASVCQPIAVVLGANAEQIKPEISQLPVQIVENQQWAEG